MTIDEIRILVLNLPRDERELLGIELLSTLGSPEDAAEIDAAWSVEILARSDAYRSGAVQCFDAAGTLVRLRDRLTTRNAP